MSQKDRVNGEANLFTWPLRWEEFYQKILLAFFEYRFITCSIRLK